MNEIGNLRYAAGISLFDIPFDGYQNGFRLLGNTVYLDDRQSYNYQLGSDFFLSQNQTPGVLVNVTNQDAFSTNSNNNTISSSTDVQEYDTTFELILAYRHNYITRRPHKSEASEL